ncbi:MAG: winged helix-turn-helix transcriptional regulator [Acidimicrobiales bacterium]
MLRSWNKTAWWLEWSTPRCPRVEYRLTDYGQTALPLVDEVRRWGNRHLQRRPV